MFILYNDLLINVVINSKLRKSYNKLYNIQLIDDYYDIFLLASNYGKYKVIKYILSKNTIDEDTKNIFCTRSIMLTIKNKYYRIFKLLFKNILDNKRFSYGFSDTVNTILIFSKSISELLNYELFNHTNYCPIINQDSLNKYVSKEKCPKIYNYIQKYYKM